MSVFAAKKTFSFYISGHFRNEMRMMRAVDITVLSSKAVAKIWKPEQPTSQHFRNPKQVQKQINVSKCNNDNIIF
jgi:hypothetical protein